VIAETLTGELIEPIMFHPATTSIEAQIARKLPDMFAAMGAPRGNYEFTNAEKEILHRLVEGNPKKQIAHDLGVSFHTVDTHLRNIYAKLHVHSRSEAVAKALKERLL